jgi:multidrug transporter EmrE-like cation transporter
MNYSLLALAVAFNVGSYVIFKSVSAKPHDLAWAALFGCGLALGATNIFLFTAALRELRLATAYPIFAGASIAVIVFVSTWLFHEKITSLNLAGAAMVVLGIAFLSR